MKMSIVKSKFLIIFCFFCACSPCDGRNHTHRNIIAFNTQSGKLS